MRIGYGGGHILVELRAPVAQVSGQAGEISAVRVGIHRRRVKRKK